MRNTFLFLWLGLAASQTMAQCYTVYGPNDRILYRGRHAPVDTSKALNDTVPAQFPGGHLVFDNINDCSVQPAEAVAPSQPDTRRMGSGAAPRREVTELRNPPLRVIREGDHLVIEGRDD